MALDAEIAAWKGKGGLGSKPSVTTSAAMGPTTRAPTEATSKAPVQVKVCWEADEIAAAAAEVTDKVSLTDAEASLVDSNVIISEEACAQKIPWTHWRPY